MFLIDIEGIKLAINVDNIEYVELSNTDTNVLIHFKSGKSLPCVKLELDDYYDFLRALKLNIKIKYKNQILREN